MATLQTYKPILYEVQQAAMQLSLPVPTQVYGSTDQDVLLMGSAANLAGTMVVSAFAWQHLRNVLNCAGDGSKTQYDLPADFIRVVDNTGWSAAIRRPVVILNPQQWAMVKNWLSQSFYMNPACRIYKDQVEFISPPAIGDTVSFEYITKNYVEDAENPLILKEFIENDGDIPMFDWLLMILAIKVKWQELKGFSTVGAMSDFNDRLSQLTQQDEMGQILTLSGPNPGNFRYLDNFYNTPDTNVGM